MRLKLSYPKAGNIIQIVGVYIFIFALTIRYILGLVFYCLHFQVGQKHEGTLGIIMSVLSRASTHVWFERTDAKDRSFVIRRSVILVFCFLSFLNFPF